MEKKVTAAFGWKFFERISVQGTNFLVTLLLARLLTPSDYGTVSIVTIFIALATTFVQGGFNTALIQKKDVDGNDYLTILAFSKPAACLNASRKKLVTKAMLAVRPPGTFIFHIQRPPLPYGQFHLHIRSQS